MRDLIFLRHGVAQRVTGRCIGQTDVALSADGAVEIRRTVTNGLGTTYENAHRDISLFSSDLARASDSAAILGDALGVSLALDPRLREMGFGEWEGRDWSEIARTDGRRYEQWAERWTELAPPGGESFSDVRRRAADWIADAAASATDTCQVVVSHAGWVRAALVELVGLDPARIFEWPVDHARATIVRIDATGPSIIARNVDHIGCACRASASVIR